MTDTRRIPVDEYLPLKPLICQILLALAEEEHHGYAILHAVRERSGGRIRINTGPLYRHLKRLLDDGLVEESDYRPAPDHDDHRRRYYRLTATGREVIAAEAERMAELVEQIRQLGDVEAKA